MYLYVSAGICTHWETDIYTYIERKLQQGAKDGMYSYVFVRCGMYCICIYMYNVCIIVYWYVSLRIGMYI